MDDTGDDAISLRVARGVDAYARGALFDAHERFEEAWLASGAPRSLELHALAQVAAAMHKHVVHAKPEAARAIMTRARAKLARVEASSHGLDLDALRAAIDAWLKDPRDDAPPITRA